MIAHQVFEKPDRCGPPIMQIKRVSTLHQLHSKFLVHLVWGKRDRDTHVELVLVPLWSTHVRRRRHKVWQNAFALMVFKTGGKKIGWMKKSLNPTGNPFADPCNHQTKVPLLKHHGLLLLLWRRTVSSMPLFFSHFSSLPCPPKRPCNPCSGAEKCFFFFFLQWSIPLHVA